MTEEPSIPITQSLDAGGDGLAFEGAAPAEDSGASMQMGVVWARLNASLGQRQDEDLVYVGRFVILETLGQGAMGVVYRAYDPKLDRRVALKFVQHGAGTTVGSTSVSEVEREARAAADLHHPNIVTIYDVGTHDDRMFLAMELVDGPSLRRVLERARSWRETVALFAEIANGLAAAHAHGIVHRDFKPDNVLVGSDGRPRIADFGLARPVEGWSARETERREQLGDGAVPVAGGSTPSTIAGLCGTPAYMSPEHFTGEPVGPAADQFAFCVSLYEALLGARPHRGSTVEELSVRIVEGTREALPAGHGLPRALLEILERGMAHDVAERFPSMEALADRLRDVLAIRRRRRIAGALVGVGLLATLTGVGVSMLAAEQPCEDVADLLAPTWNESRRTRILEVLPAQELVTRLDDYAQEWIERRRETCESTLVHGTRSELAMELQVACLERARARLEAVAQGLGEGSMDGTLPEVEDILLPLTSCDDVEELERAAGRLSSRSTFDSESARALHYELERTMGELRTRHRLGHPVDEALAELVQRAHDAGVRHHEAQARHLQARLAHERGALDDAAQGYEQALRLALAARWDHLAQRVLSDRIQLLLDVGRVSEASAMLVVLEGLTERAPEPGEQRQPAWQVTSLRGNVALAAGQFAEAESLLLQATQEASRVEAPGSDARLKLRNNLANAYQARDRYDRAAAEYEAILEQLERRGEGEGHTAATAHSNLALAYTNLGDYERAPDHYARGLALVEALAGEDHPMTQMILNNWGWMEREQGKLTEAAAKQQRALAIAERVFGPEHPTLAYALDELGMLGLARGDLDAAREHFERALELRTGALGEEHPSLAETRVGLGEVDLARGDLDAAREHFERALAVLGDPPQSPRATARARAGLETLASQVTHTSRGGSARGTSPK